MENYKKRAIRFLVNLSLKEKRDPRVVKYGASKTEISKTEEKYFPRNVGGTDGRYAAVLYDMLKELESQKRACIHSIMVLKDNEIVCEASARGYDTSIFHLAYSMSKTVTAIAVGLLFDDKKIRLDDYALSYFPEIDARSERKREITVSDLLTMKSGAGFSEIGVISEIEWTRAFFEDDSYASPGNRFKYNSMNSYVLARIVTRIAGMPLSDFLNERLFTPLGIKNYFWELSPEGTEKGGFGLYLSAESFLKIGLMLKNRGSFGGQRILSEEFVSLMLTPYSSRKDTDSEYGYGLHIWVSESGDEFLLSGMLGQSVLVSESTGFIVSINAGNNEIFSESPTLPIVKKHLSRVSEGVKDKRSVKLLKEASEGFFSSREVISSEKQKRTLSQLFGFKKSNSFDERWELISGEYAPRSNNASILPLLVRIIQNNFPGGIERIGIKRADIDLILTFTEGHIPYEINVGLYAYRDNVLNFDGEKYLIRARGECALDEDKSEVYKIELIFPELPSSRLLKITRSEGGIILKMSESPNEAVADAFFDSMIKEGRIAFIIGLIEKRMGQGFFKERIRSAFNPTLDCIDTKKYGWEATLMKDNLKLAEKREISSKFISSLISKFLNEKREKEEGSGGFLKNFFSTILGLVFEKLKPDDDSSETIELSDDIITFLDSNE